MASLVPALLVVVNPPAAAADAAPYVPIRCPALHATQGFGDTRFEHPHTGIDLVCPGGTAVRAIAAGVFRQRWGGAGRCAYPSWAVGGLGLYGEVDAGDTEYIYGHLAAVAIAAGTAVTPGTILGYEGSTGCSTGAHLHFEVRVAGRATNPCAFLPPGYPSRHVPSPERCWGPAPP